jgi:hypothetical protein
VQTPSRKVFLHLFFFVLTRFRIKSKSLEDNLVSVAEESPGIASHGVVLLAWVAEIEWLVVFALMRETGQWRCYTVFSFEESALILR